MSTGYGFPPAFLAATAVAIKVLFPIKIFLFLIFSDLTKLLPIIVPEFTAINGDELRTYCYANPALSNFFRNI